MGGPAVVRGDYAEHLHFAGLVVDVDFGDLRGIDIRGERFAVSGFRVQGDGRRIERAAANRRRARDPAGVFRHIADVQMALRETLDADFVVLCFELTGLHTQERRRHVEEDLLGLIGCGVTALPVT